MREVRASVSGTGSSRAPGWDPLPQLETRAGGQDTAPDGKCPGGGTVDAERLKRPERKLVPVRVRPRVHEAERREPLARPAASEGAARRSGRVLKKTADPPGSEGMFKVTVPDGRPPARHPPSPGG